MTVSIEQIEAFVTITREGSFSAAGRVLGKAQSAISTAVNNLEIDLGVTLFDRSARYPVLTLAGSTLLKDALAVLEDRQTLIDRGLKMAEGEPGELTLAILSMLPLDPIFGVLKGFRDRHPDCRLRVVLLSAGDAATALEEPLGPTLLFSFLADAVAYHHRVRSLGYLPLVAVAAPATQLAEHRGQVPVELLREQLQIVLSDRVDAASPDRGVYSRNTWRVSDHNAKHELLRAGFGWGFMPLPMVAKDLQKKRLIRFGCDLWGEQIVPQVFALATSTPDVGKVGRALFDELCTVWRQALPPSGR